jgi:RNA polymerase sigma-70 factor (ECF subfamily)
VIGENEPITVKDLQNLIGELRAMARGLLYAESRSHSITPTALALSALRRAKLQDQDWNDVRWENRAHFFGMLMIAMKHALIDRARAAEAQKRARITYLPGNDPLIEDLATEAVEQPERIINLYEALERLKKAGPTLAELLEQHYFMGYSINAMAAYSKLDERTIKRRLDRARVMLRKLIEELLKGK